jgi:hypothetical protein
MIADVKNHRHISVFTENPLLLTAVCILYQDGKRLPEQRADLYDRVVGNLLYKRFQDGADPYKAGRIEECLMHPGFCDAKSQCQEYRGFRGGRSNRDDFPQGRGREPI